MNKTKKLRIAKLNRANKKKASELELFKSDGVSLNNKREKLTGLLLSNEENASELLTANNTFSIQNDENNEHVSELIKANEKNAFGLKSAAKAGISKNKDKNEQVVELIKANEDNALALVSANKDFRSQSEEKNEYVAKLIFANEENALRLIIATDKEFKFQKEELEKLDSKLGIIHKELAIQNIENEEKTLELMNANLKLVFNYEEKEKISAEFSQTNKELAIQQKDKVAQAIELINANIKLVLNYKEKEQRASELIIANKELVYQNIEKEKRAAELVIANLELLHQNKVKQQQATELKIVNDWYLQSEENFRRSISESPLGIRIITMKGKTIYVNKAFLKMYEFNSLEEFESIPSIEWYTPESYVQHLKRAANRKKGLEVTEYEKSMITKNGGIRHVKVWRNEVLWNGVKHYQIINLDITEQKRTEEALKNTQLELRKFATHLQEIREEEKIGLSREIHDDLGQILVALKIDLGMFKKELSKGMDNVSSEQILGKFDELSNLVDKTIKTTRRIMNGLRPELIELLGFEEAAKSYLHEFQERLHIPCQFKCDILKLNINQQQSVALFRILQEALTNVAKHAQATSVKLQLSIRSHKLVMEIIDNGIGFDENQTTRQDSYGMIGMKERVFLLEGQLFISGKPGKGTTIRVEIPYNHEPPS